MLVRQHLGVPGFRGLACVREEPRGCDDNNLSTNLVRGIHEEVVNRLIAATLTSRFAHVGRVADDDVKAVGVAREYLDEIEVPDKGEFAVGADGA